MSSRRERAWVAPVTAGVALLLAASVAPSPGWAEGNQPTTGPAAADTADPVGQQLSLSVGEAVWWDSTFPPADDDEPRRVPWLLPSQEPPPSKACGVTIPCQDHELVVVGPVDSGSRLRVAMTNWPGYAGTDVVDLAVVLPDGEECRPAQALAATHGAQVSIQYGYSLEAFIRAGGRGDCDREVVPGTYVVRAFGATTREDGPTPYRLRAALEAPVHSRSERRLLPDLVPEAPPYGFAFGCQPSPDSDIFNKLLVDSPPHETTPEEHRGNGVLWDRICLRYAFTYGNAGDGLLDLVFDPRTTGSEAPIRQRIYRADTTTGRYEDGQAYDEWSAGTAHFHATHRHWHVSGFYNAHLLKVLHSGDGLDPGHPAREAVKQGLCTSPWYLLAFDRILPDEPDVPSTGCDLNEFGRPEVEEIRIPLAAGWADLYDTIQPDNFVDVTGELPPVIDGERQYVLRFRINPGAVREVGAGHRPLPDGGFIAESDLTNNTAYAHLRITTPEPGTYAVCLLGRGFGDDPWAPNAQPVAVGDQPCSTGAAPEAVESGA
jgi:hypothetical protein